ncbi:MAG: PAS domain S-box protein, partial [Desulfobacteraceae bacterium]|nr:PAS domain S-box protein [Desulfobacteraceae bacterium]
MISKFLEKFGVAKGTFVIAGISIVFSVALYLIIGLVSGGVLVKGIIISIIIPAIVAPLVSYHFLRVWLQLYLSEKELRKSEQRLRELAELLPETIYEMGAKGNLTFVNRYAFDHFGYTRHDFDRGLNALDMLIPEDRNRAMENVEKILRGEKPSITDYTALRKDGTTFPVMVRSTAIMHDGKPVGLRGFIVDITDRKNAEETLRQSEKKYSDLFENVSDFIYIHDLEGKFIETNLPFIEDMSYGEENLANLNVRDLIPERHKSQFEDYLKRIKENGKAEGLMKVMTKDGRERIIEYRNSLVYGLSGSKVVRGSARDITERIQAEMELRKSEEKYRKLYDESKRAEEVYSSILHTSADAMIIYDMEGKTRYVSPAFTQIFGWTMEEVEGKRIPFLPESEREATMAGIKEIIGNGKAIQGFETKRYTKDGRIIDVSISGSRYNDHEGKPAGMLVILRDTSEKKTMEAQLQRAQKMEAIGTLAGGVAHDLNNILSGLVSYPELILMDLPEDSVLKNPILTIKKSGEKAAAIVQDLLTLARRGVAVTEVVNLNNIISEYLKSPEFDKLKFYQPNIQVETDLDRELLNISGSPVHISKAIMNLVSNAAEAMPHGGYIFISVKNQYIDKPIRGYDDVAEGDYVVLSISDTGVGISPEDMERIFEPFYTKKIMGRSGTGLGMSVVWGTIKDHKGYIDVKSTEEKGTTFTLYFPVTIEEAVREKSSISIEDYMGKGESILVVDDVEEQREIASGMLKKLGYSITALSSGEEAVEYMKDKSVDLLVLDMIMDPGIDGLETYKRILEFHPNQKAIISSGFSETDRVKEAQKLGSGQYIKKPYTMGNIGIAVRAE